MTTDKSSEREALIKAMVDRFLGWKLPKSFGPDGGVSFERTVNGAPREHDSHWWPIGTNLFTATEARAMVEHMLGEPPSVDDFPPCGALHEARAALPQQAQAPRCNAVFEALGLDPDRYTTEGGAINIPRLRATIKHPSEYLPPDHWMNSPR